MFIACISFVFKLIRAAEKRISLIDLRDCEDETVKEKFFFFQRL